MAEKLTHTLGPWSATDNSWEVSSIYGPDDCLIAEVQIHPSVTEDNQHDLELVKEANARLIAAAPEMLAALQEAEGEIYQVPPADAEQERVLAIVRAAIARATGRAALNQTDGGA